MGYLLDGLRLNFQHNGYNDKFATLPFGGSAESRCFAVAPLDVRQTISRLGGPAAVGIDPQVVLPIFNGSIIRTSQRTPQIGVRIAMEAGPSSIFGLVVGQGLRLSAVGIGIGLIAATGLTRVMNSTLVGVKPADPLTFGAIVLLFFAIAAVACWISAFYASSLDPTVALREE